MSNIRTLSKKHKIGWNSKDWGATTLTAVLEMAIDEAMADIDKKAVKWAKNTEEYWKDHVPVDTGNLKNSIEIDNHLNESNPYILVGVNEEKLKGPKTLRSTVTRKVHYRTIPAYNYVPFAEKNARDTSLRFFVEKLWLTYAEKEAGRIFN